LAGGINDLGRNGSKAAAVIAAMQRVKWIRTRIPAWIIGAT
jgi:hypothetical protein